MKLNMLLTVIAIFLNLFAINATQAQTTQPTNQHCDVLYAGQTTAVGSVCVTVNASDVNLDYLLIGDWKLTEAHAWIGDTLTGLPSNSGGNPQIGLFPYQASINSAAQYSFTIPISQLAVNADTFCNAEIFVAAHAVVTRTVAGGSGDNGSGDDGKSAKSGKSEKSGKAGKSSSASKSSSSTASSGKGTTDNAVASTSAGKGKSSAAGKGKSNAAGKAGKSDQSGKSGHSGKSGKSGNQTGGGSGNPSTQTESAWAGSMQIANGGSWARYFSFTNDFCVEPEIPVVVLPPSCFNVFGMGVEYPDYPVTATAFTPVGVTGTASAWRNTYSASPTGVIGGSLISGTGLIVGDFIAGLGGNSDVFAELYLDGSASPSLTFESANVYFNTAGAYQNKSPLDYGLSLTGNTIGDPIFGGWPLNGTPEIMDTIIHAVVCSKGFE
jgi:hypothetical protein